MQVYFLEVNGRRMPEPYFTYQEAQAARDELKRNSCALCVNVVRGYDY